MPSPSNSTRRNFASGKLDHGVRELDLAARTALQRLRILEDFRLQDVRRDGKFDGAVALRRLFHHAFDREHAARVVALAARRCRIMRQMLRHSSTAIRLDLVAEVSGTSIICARQPGVFNTSSPEHHRERLIADDVARAPHAWPGRAAPADG